MSGRQRAHLPRRDWSHEDGGPASRALKAAEANEEPADLPYPPSELLTAEQVEASLAWLRRRMIRRHTLEAYCESPIEADLAIMILEALPQFRNGMKVGFCAQGDLKKILEITDYHLILVPQFLWRRYRIDFALVSRYIGCDKIGLIFIECDGKEFHSSPSQLARDKRKDEEAADAGIPLLRFSGSELFRFDPFVFKDVWQAVLDQSEGP